MKKICKEYLNPVGSFGRFCKVEGGCPHGDYKMLVDSASKIMGYKCIIDGNLPETKPIKENHLEKVTQQE